MLRDEIELSPFTAREPQQRYRAGRRTDYRAARRGSAQVRAGSMWLKIGFCMAVLGAAVLTQKLLLDDAGNAPSVVEAASETEDDDVLGRLRFVEGGAVRSVFATSQRWRMPVENAAASLGDEERLLTLSARAGEEVSVSAAGEVRAVGSDDVLGRFIRVHHGGDLESVYYNVDDIRVEEGQPLLASDTLGVVGEGGRVHVRVTASGTPQLPAAYLDVAE